MAKGAIFPELIGAEDNRVINVWCDRIHVKEVIDYSGSAFTVGPDAETKHGIQVGSNGKITLHDTIASAATFDSTITVTGESTFNGILRVNANVDISTSVVSGDGGATGFHMTANDAYFDDKIFVTGVTQLNGAVDINANTDISGTLTVGGAVDINANTDISGTLTMSGGNIILSGHYLSNDGGNEGVSVANDGKVECSFDLTAVGTIYGQGGIESSTYVTASAASYLLGGYLSIKDSFGEPATLTGYAKIYVDTDGKMYGKDGAGNIGLITDFT